MLSSFLLRIQDENSNNITLSGLLLYTPVFAAPINNKSSINQQVGYSFGYLMGRSNAESIQDLDLDAFVQGLREDLKFKLLH